MTKRKETYKVLREYLAWIELHPFTSKDDLFAPNDFRRFSIVPDFYDSEEQTSHHLVVPHSADATLISAIDQVFESKVKAKAANDAIYHEILNGSEFPFTETDIDRICRSALEALHRLYTLQVDALVPLFNIECGGSFEIPLANTILYSGGSDSTLARSAKSEILPEDFLDKRERNRVFLKVSVAGDNENRRLKAEEETEHALRVLRFVTSWRYVIKGNREIATNKAHLVSQWNPDMRTILYVRPEHATKAMGYEAFRESPMQISEQFVSYARDHLGLDDINFHFRNRVRNSISERVCRALRFYDNGALAHTNWQALYNYVVSIDVVLPTKDKYLVQDLQTLIHFGNHYVGTFATDESLPDSENEKWSVGSKLTAKQLKEYRILRGRILHGDNRMMQDTTLADDEISEKDLSVLRLLAHNALRLFSRLSRKKGWQTKDEAENWFKSKRHQLSSEE